jgi:hypothetical protein
MDTGPDSVAILVEKRTTDREERTLAALTIADQLDRLFCDDLGVDEAGRSYLDDEVAVLPTRYPDQDIKDTDAVLGLLQKPMADAIDEMTSIAGGSRNIARLFYFYDRRIEVLSHFFACHPAAVVRARQSAGVLEQGALVGAAKDVISWLVGASFGRWDIRARPGDGGFDPFSPVSLCPPGMLVGLDGYPVEDAPPGYPIAIPPDGVLLDQPGHTLDLTGALEDVAQVLGDTHIALLEDSFKVLGAKTLRDYLARSFFKVHLARYAVRGRQAPVYWQLTVPSRRWSAWLYAPRFSREMLYVLAGLIEHRRALAAEQIQAWTEDPDATRRNRKAIDDERTLAAELAEFGADVERLAALGWRPDLDDGAVLCAAPLARWFPAKAWPKLAEHLTKLKAGEYPWASVHRYREAL